MAADIILIADSVFFVKTIDAPAGLSDGDLEDFVETSAEAFSPLASDRLCRCFFKKGNGITVFATLAEKAFEGLSESEIRAASLVMPASAVLFSAPLGDGVVCLDSGKSISAAEIKNGVFANFAAVRKTGADAGDRAKLGALFDSESIAGARFFSLSKCELARGGKTVELELSEVGMEGVGIAWTVQRKSLLSCDLRDKKLFMQSEKQKRKAAVGAAFVKAVPVFFALLLLWQAVLLFKEASAESMREQLGEVEPLAKSVEIQSEQIGELKSFTTQKLHAIANLAYLNSLRPDDIVFLQVSQEYPSNVSIKGRAPSMESVEAFIGALRKDGTADVSLSNSSSNKDGASFTINLRAK